MDRVDGGYSRWTIALQGAVILILAIVNVGWNTVFEAPPRFDGAGYAVLAESIRQGRGYRAIDHPEAPRHAHFPPGYPASLALIWLIDGGPSERSAHLFSMACTLAAILLTWHWFRRLERPRVAFLLGLALATNWTWGRQGGSIQSEPLFLMIQMLAVLATGWACRGIGPSAIVRGVMLGALLGAATLTRQVGIMLAVASGIVLLNRQRWITAVAAGASLVAILAPWIAWLAWVGQGTQVALLFRRGLADLLASQTLFYLRRLPDQVLGPFVEVGTVFRPNLAFPVTVWAILATTLIAWGWLRLLRRPRKRLAGLVPLATLTLLLVWPFTEAGRFLLPIVPFVILGLFEGLAALLARLGVDHRMTKVWASGLVLALSLPYSAYAILSQRSLAAQASQADFDSACAWIARQADQPGPILTRQPGEAFWQTGRTALPPPEDLNAIDSLLRRFGVAYLILDEDRYARAPSSPLSRFATEHPERFKVAWSQGSVTVLEVRALRPPVNPDSAKKLD